MKRPTILSDVKPEQFTHVDGRQVRDDIVRSIREALMRYGGCHCTIGSGYHDYLSGGVAYLAPTPAVGQTVLDAIRAALPDWRRVDVSIHWETNSIWFTCYAHDTISTGPAPLAQHPIAA